MNSNVISNEESDQNDPSKIIQTEEEEFILHEVPLQLHSAQQEINNLRLLNVCLQSTLLRVQTQLIDYLPIKRNETQEKFALLRQTDDHTRRIIHDQHLSFSQLFNTFKKEQIPLTKTEKQIDILHEMFHELNTIIHTEHNDRICQLYITLAETSQSVIRAREVLDTTIHAHKILTQKQTKQKIFFLLITFTFISIVIFILIISLRIH